MSEVNPIGYGYADTAPGCTSTYLWAPVFNLLSRLHWSEPKRKVFDLGCGNGALAAALAERGYAVTGVDPSDDGIRLANQAYPGLALFAGSAYDDLVRTYGQFPALISLEVVEHVFYPRSYAKTVHDLLEPGGTALISTPYHGYIKNLALAVAGHWDQHLSPLWDYGHIKFWSIRTLTALLHEVGLSVEQVLRVGRIPPLAKSMILVARRPNTR